MPAISSTLPSELPSRLEFSAMAASRVANMPHLKPDTPLSKAASGALTLSVIWDILVTPNPKPVFVSLIGVTVRRPSLTDGVIRLPGKFGAFPTV